jgi:glucokinase
MSLEQIYQTSAYDRFDQALDAFLATDAAKSSPPQAAAFACAGPVRKQRCEFTNLGWVVDADEVSKQFNLRSRVLNDFEAVGYGVPALGEHDILVLNNVPAEEKGPKAVLGPGTGLGEAQLFWDDSINNYKVYASEGSHATFAPRGWKQRALQARVEAERGHCSVERVACGSGLVRIYDFLHSDEVSNRPGVTKLTNPTPADVSIAAMSGNDPIATEALDMLLAIVGAEASHMALRSLSSGGVYIAGGILPKVVERVKQGGVLEAFLWKASRFHDKVLKDIPLYVVLEERVGLIGSREQAIQLVQMARDDVYIST